MFQETKTEPSGFLTLPRATRPRLTKPVFTPTGYISPAASLRKKTKVEELRDMYRDNMKEFDRITGGMLGLTHSNSLFSEILNTNSH